MSSQKPNSAFFFGYGIGDYGLNIYWNSLSLILVFWYADVVGLDPRHAGAIFAIGVLCDAVSDPIVAVLAERNHSRFGTYRPFLLFGSFILGVSFVFLFWKPPWQGNLLIIHLIIIHILFRLSYTIVAVPYSALMARITYSSEERADLSGVRMGFAFLGLLTVSWCWFPLIRFFGNGQENSAVGTLLTAMIGAGIATIALLACFALTREKPVPGENTIQHEMIIQSFWNAITKNRALQILLILTFINSAAGLSLSAPLAFYIEANSTIFANKEVIFTTLAIFNLLAVPVWTVIIRRIGKKKSWAAASLWLVACGIHWALMGPLVIQGVPLQLPAMGFSTSGLAILIWAITPNTIEYGQYAYGKRAEGAAFGSVLFSQKVSQAIMGYAIGAMLSWIGYNSSAELQQPEVAEKIGLFIALMPPVLVLLSIFIVFTLPLNKTSHAKIVHALSETDIADKS